MLLSLSTDVLTLTLHLEVHKMARVLDDGEVRLYRRDHGLWRAWLLVGENGRDVVAEDDPSRDCTRYLYWH